MLLALKEAAWTPVLIGKNHSGCPVRLNDVNPVHVDLIKLCFLLVCSESTHHQD